MTLHLEISEISGLYRLTSRSSMWNTSSSSPAAG